MIWHNGFITMLACTGVSGDFTEVDDLNKNNNKVRAFIVWISIKASNLGKALKLAMGWKEI